MEIKKILTKTAFCNKPDNITDSKDLPDNIAHHCTSTQATPKYPPCGLTSTGITLRAIHTYDPWKIEFVQNLKTKEKYATVHCGILNKIATVMN